MKNFFVFSTVPKLCVRPDEETKKFRILLQKTKAYKFSRTGKLNKISKMAIKIFDDSKVRLGGTRYNIIHLRKKLRGKISEVPQIVFQGFVGYQRKIAILKIPNVPKTHIPGIPKLKQLQQIVECKRLKMK